MIKVFVLMVVCVGSVRSWGQSIPELRGPSFGGTQVNLPGDLKGKIGVFILGFDRKSAEQTKGWGDYVLRDYGNDAKILYYQMPILADVPGWIRGMVVQGIKRQLSETERPHFVAIVDAVAGWKRAARFGAVDDAYVIVVDSTGQVAWRTHGFATADGVEQINLTIAKLRNMSGAH